MMTVTVLFCGRVELIWWLFTMDAKMRYNCTCVKKEVVFFYVYSPVFQLLSQPNSITMYPVVAGCLFSRLKHSQLHHRLNYQELSLSLRLQLPLVAILSSIPYIVTKRRQADICLQVTWTSKVVAGGMSTFFSSSCSYINDQLTFSLSIHLIIQKLSIDFN